MVPKTRPTLQRDLKDRRTTQSTSGEHHFVLASFTALALFAVYISINTPSASTADISEINEKSDIHAATIFPDVDLPVASKLAASKSMPQGQPELIDETELEAGFSIISSLGNRLQPNAQLPTLEQSLVEQTRGERLDTEIVSEQSDQTNNQEIQLANFLESQPWISTEVRKGDSLSKILNRNNIGARHAYAITQYEDAKSLLKISPGQEIKIKKNQQGELALLHYQVNTFDTLTVKATNKNYIVEIDVREPEVRLNNAKATIYRNLLGAANEVNISLKTMYNFIDMFGWQVDFTMDLHAGDQFSIIYEELYLNNKYIGDGNIIAAELVNSGHILQAIRHQDEEGFINYYAPDGSGIKGTFLRTPLKFGNVTSNFSKKRLHPIKKVWTAHQGVDYGAPRGTPVRATGDGTVRHAGGKGGYGKTIIIRHGRKYDTVYAHLNGYAKGITAGARVKQGDTIGYVGSSGLATGPHLHYEFRIDGVHKNPMTVKLPRSESIPQKYKSQFNQFAGIWVAELDYLNRIPLAQNQVNQ